MRRPRGGLVARSLAGVGLRRSVIVGLVAVVGVIVLSGGASAAPPTTLVLCINPGGNVTSPVPPETTCGPNQTEFDAVSAQKEAADIAAVQAAAAADETADTAEVANLQGQIDTTNTNISNDETADAPGEAFVAGARAVINGIIDVINGISCVVSFGTDCTPLSHV